MLNKIIFSISGAEVIFYHIHHIRLNSKLVKKIGSGGGNSSSDNKTGKASMLNS
jgi:hypothetical protein